MNMHEQARLGDACRKMSRLQDLIAECGAAVKLLSAYRKNTPPEDIVRLSISLDGGGMPQGITVPAGVIHDFLLPGVVAALKSAKAELKAMPGLEKRDDG